MTALALVAAQLLDWLTAMTHGPYWYERNPIAARLLDDPVAATIEKAALVVLLVSVVAIIRPTRPWLARLVVVVGVGAGALGAVSNVA